jgi:alkanesulfonate monooxygenase SsuD/methylene tetrahydromethanopterin reductase-like flavin-dependent oxidoreductase (luciferase family)
MRFGLSLVSQHRGRPAEDAYAEMLEQVAVAEASGFDAVFVSEHHPASRTGDYCFQPVPVLAALASRTRRIRLGTSVLLPPLYQPWRLAEELLTIQAASQGRLILGVGAGFDASEFEAHGVAFSARFKLLEEAVRLLRAEWNEAAAHVPGTRPPPVWVAGTTPVAIRRAARLGDAWLPPDTARLDALKEAQHLYTEAMRAAGKDPLAVERPLMREALVHEDPATARRRLSSPVVSRYRAYWAAGDIQLRAEFPDGDLRYADLEPSRFIVGDPGQCIRLIDELRRELGTTFLILRIPKPELSQAVTLEAIRMFGEQVIPRIREVATRLDELIE